MHFMLFLKEIVMLSGFMLILVLRRNGKIRTGTIRTMWFKISTDDTCSDRNDRQL